MGQKIVNRLPHARSMKVQIDGKEHEIDHLGVMHDVDEALAQKLLLNKQVWGLYDERNPPEPVRAQRVALVDDKGKLHYHDNASTRAQASGSPLISDGKEGRDHLHAVDSAHTHQSVEPLLSEDPDQVVPTTPPHLTASQADAHVDFRHINTDRSHDRSVHVLANDGKQPGPDHKLADNPPIDDTDKTTAVVPVSEDDPKADTLVPTDALANQSELAPGPTPHDIAEGELGDEETTPDETGKRKRGRHHKQ